MSENPYTSKRTVPYRVSTSPDSGDGGNFPKAVLFGILGGILGAALYAVFAGYTRTPIGYMTIPVGFLVAKSMMIGSRGRGGTKYQVTAALLTYLAASIGPVLLECWDSWDDLIVNPTFVLKASVYSLESPARIIHRFDPTSGINVLILLVALGLAWFIASGSRRRASL